MTRWTTLIAMMCATVATIGAEDAAPADGDTVASEELVAVEGGDDVGNGDGAENGDDAENDDGEQAQSSSRGGMRPSRASMSIWPVCALRLKRSSCRLVRSTSAPTSLLPRMPSSWQSKHGQIHEAARLLRDDILGLLGERSNRLRMATLWVAQIKDVAVQSRLWKCSDCLTKATVC